MARLTCGIDIGSTNVKVVLADEAGRAVHTRTVPSPRVSDGIGPTTDAAALVTLLESIIIDGWREVGDGEPLAAIAAAGVGEDGIGVDANLRPTGLALPWFDTRAVAQAEALRRSAAATPRAGIAVDWARTAAKWLWLRHHRPDELRAARQWIALTDYPAVWWSGVPFMSGTLAARTACYDVYDRHWIGPLLEASGAPPLPALRIAGQAAGSMRPGPLTEVGAADAITLLVVGGHDHPVAAATIRAVAPAARVDSMGTANLVYGEAGRPPEPYLDPFMAFSVPPSDTDGVACLGVVELGATMAAANIDEALLRRVLNAKRLPGGPGPDRGGISGSERLVIRSVLERATFHTRRMFEAMDQAGAPPGPIFSTGGWARSRAFLELRASIFGQSVNVIDEPELTAIGAAFLAFQAAKGAAPRLEATRQIDTIDPVADWSRAYAEIYPTVVRDLEAAIHDRQEPGSATTKAGGRTIRGGH